MPLFVATMVLSACPLWAQTSVNLSSAFNVNSGIVRDGTTFVGGGLDGDGGSYSANQLGSTQTANGMTFTLGPANALDAVSQATVALPAVQGTSIGLLATGVNGSQTGQSFTVTYTDNTSQSFTQDLSDWLFRQNYPGESIAAATSRRNNSNGSADNFTFNLYSYVFASNSAKTLKSITLPNNRNVVVLAISIDAKNTNPLSLSAAFNREGIVTDNTAFANGGLDGDGSSYSSNLLGSSLTFDGVSLSFGTANANNAVSAAGQTISLPTGESGNNLLLLATGVNGNQAGQKFIVNYSDGSNSSFTQDISDWATPQNYPGETTVARTSYRDNSDGTKDHSTYNLYGYDFSLPNGKIVNSITLPNSNNVEVLAMALANGSGGGSGGIVGDCGQAPSGSGSGNVDYVMVYKSSLSAVCVDSTFWANSTNATAIRGFFPYFDAVVTQDKALFPVATPNTQFVFEITVPTGGASTGCGFSSLGNGGQFCDTVTGDAFTNVYNDSGSGNSVPGFFGYLLTLHESINVFTGLVSSGWPTDWWADHRSPFPNAMDAEFMQSIANNNSLLTPATKQALLNSATAQFNRFTNTSNPTGEFDSEVVMFVNFFNQFGGFNAYANAFNFAVNQDGLRWPSVSKDPNFTGDDDFSENLSEYVIAYLQLGFGATSNLTSTFSSAGVGTKDTSIPSYTINANNVKTIAAAHCSIRAAANTGINVTAQLSALQMGNFQNATATGGTQASCPSECAFINNKCTTKF